MLNPVHIINQLFEMQSKIRDTPGSVNLDRNFSRLFSMLEEEGYVIQDPTGEPYRETRTDCEASISGKLSSKMKITRTMKPVIYQRQDSNLQIVQKAVVIVE